MTQSLEAVAQGILFNKDKIEAVSPGSFVQYNDEKKKSSHVTLATTEGVILKEKIRSAEKTLYEFFALEAWSRLMDSYSECNDLTFRAPTPIGVLNMRQERTGLLMKFLNGYQLKKIGNLKRSTPVIIKGQRLPLPLYPACAFHLGALNRIKEEEQLYHEDYDDRHIIFSPVSNVGIGVIDLENSRIETDPQRVLGESLASHTQFQQRTPSEKDRANLESWYSQGMESVTVPDSSNRLGAILESINRKYGIDFDMVNKKINGFSLGN